ncbi:energy transducer TonB [Anaeromyxobacter terrae]|uniref:energy transducer TonB n=1 Tax=Anaeromyxobacter terrae TaxID=2925406 RepID=UPI001F5AA457|nr:energy transducer TonB [Anaeromyxobacter sp. SG22]
MFESVLRREATGKRPAPECPVRDPVLAGSLFERIAPFPPGAIPPARRGSAPDRGFPSAGAPAPSFEAVGRRDLGRRTRRRMAWATLAASAEAMAIGCAGVIAWATEEPPPEAPAVVEVRFASSLPRRAGPPRAPGAPRAPAAAARPRDVPGRARALARIPPPRPAALLQPREVPVQMRAPDPGEPSEDVGLAEAPEAAAGAVDEGVVGGIPGGVGGGEWGAGDGLAAPPGSSAGIEDAPRWATAGFRAATEAEPGCVARSVRLPRELAGFTSGPMVVRFAVLASGAVDRIEILSGMPDARVRQAIADAVRRCRWRAGADAQGRPTALWLILPIRFESV